jgi:hypothetical protein
MADPGFEVSDAQQRFFDWLVAGGFANSDMQALDAAMNHIELHAIQRGTEPGPIAAETCLVEPCPAAGVALALYETTVYRIEAAHDLIGLIRGLDNLGDELARVERGPATEVMTRALQQHDQFQALVSSGKALLDRDYFDVACRAPAELFRALDALRERAGHLAQVLRTYVDSPAANAPTGGRPEQTLLVAVTQHLRAGGFTYAEIADLVPDGIGGGADAAQERARKRAKSEDRRRLVPHPQAGHDTGNKPP